MSLVKVMNQDPRPFGVCKPDWHESCGRDASFCPTASMQSCFTSGWALEALPYHDGGIYICIIKLLGPFGCSELASS